MKPYCRHPESGATRVLAWLNEYPGLTTGELAVALGMTMSEVSGALGNLRSGFCARHDSGKVRERRYRLTKMGLQSLENMQRALDHTPENVHARDAEAGACC